jgi:hypothetical protein
LNDGFEAKSFSVVLPRPVFANGILSHLKTEKVKTGWFSLQGLKSVRTTGLTWFHFQSNVGQPRFQDGFGLLNAFTGREKDDQIISISDQFRFWFVPAFEVVSCLNGLFHAMQGNIRQ